MTGNITRGSDLREMEDQVSFISGDMIVTYGLYDAGSGQAGLPNTRRQVFIQRLAEAKAYHATGSFFPAFSAPQ